MKLPERVRIVEVGPRDGLQNEASPVATDTKVMLVRRLAAAGLDTVEATSFVSPQAVPQLADAGDVMDTLTERPPTIPSTAGAPTRLPVLVPNMRGYEAARAHGATEVAVFTAASERFNQRNTNATIAESIERFRPIVEAAHRDGVGVRGYISTAFGCPFEGPIAADRVADVGRRLVELGISELSVGDTIGVATPADIEPVIQALAVVTPLGTIGLHLHDTRGTALANAWEGLRLGVTTFDASVSGLGGCPFAPGATGNLATEDLVFMLHRSGIETGVDLEALVETSRWISERMERLPGSHVARARLWPWVAEPE